MNTYVCMYIAQVRKVGNAGAVMSDAMVKNWPWSRSFVIMMKKARKARKCH